eukprot:NODE_1435_length_861_cov_128.452316_g1388_i0.p1 GENE.NODE_1435_length_861_cov_128.452316_g1388_i0~~NODE_1435_length_861_cov_128.452316_g1388_i0.p1  ORF type:complete len:219 (-),score=99.09 NODE_1435_length_861_cov_128.452316_g1388_i0:92-748(-)
MPAKKAGAKPAAKPAQKKKAAAKPQRKLVADASGVYVTNLVLEGGVNHDSIRAAFSGCGKISEIRVRKGGRTPYALLFFDNQAGSKKALDMNGKLVGEKKISVAAAQTSRTPDLTTTASTVFVGNLGGVTSKKQLQAAFGKCGEVQAVKVRRQPEHFGFVYFKDNGAAQKAVKTLDGTQLGDKTISVKFSKKTRDADNAQAAKKAARAAAVKKAAGKS